MMIEEKAYDEVSQLVKERCGLPYHWYQLTVDQQHFVVALLEAQKNIKVKQMKDLLFERIRYKIEEYKEEYDRFATVEEAQGAFDNLLDELGIIIDEWFEEKSRE
jgi:hypothetical protein|tara:strand:- start:249 stop:563 length:315 start_codon:yes stop_codon:yes gene_type:complete